MSFALVCALFLPLPATYSDKCWRVQGGRYRRDEFGGSGAFVSVGWSEFRCRLGISFSFSFSFSLSLLLETYPPLVSEIICSRV